MQTFYLTDVLGNRKEQVSLPTGQYNIVFEGMIASPSSSGIAITNVEVDYSGSCETKPTKCKTGEFRYF